MKEKKSLYEIIIEKLDGKWCDDLAMIELSNGEITIDNIFSINGEKISINGYTIPLYKKVFSKVIETDYENAINDFNTKNCSIISPKLLTDELITFDGCRSMQYGGNVYSHKENNEIIVNDKHHFESLDEIINFGFLSENEMNGKWMVF